MAAGSAALGLKDPGHALTRFEAARSTQQDGSGHSLRDSVLYLSRTAGPTWRPATSTRPAPSRPRSSPRNTSIRSGRACGELDDPRGQLVPHRDARAVQDFLALSAPM
jgi:hypothetical protein